MWAKTHTKKRITLSYLGGKGFLRLVCVFWGFSAHLLVVVEVAVVAGGGPLSRAERHLIVLYNPVGGPPRMGSFYHRSLVVFS
jgi:hypothetical protein